MFYDCRLIFQHIVTSQYSVSNHFAAPQAPVPQTQAPIMTPQLQQQQQQQQMALYQQVCVLLYILTVVTIKNLFKVIKCLLAFYHFVFRHMRHNNSNCQINVRCRHPPIPPSRPPRRTSRNKFLVYTQLKWLEIQIQFDSSRIPFQTHFIFSVQK